MSILQDLELILYLLYGVTDSQFLPQMLSQRILARRLPQVAARSAIAPRAPFSQIPALRAAEIEDPHQVRECLCGDEFAAQPSGSIGGC